MSEQIGCSSHLLKSFALREDLKQPRRVAGGGIVKKIAENKNSCDTVIKRQFRVSLLRIVVVAAET